MRHGAALVGLVLVIASGAAPAHGQSAAPASGIVFTSNRCIAEPGCTGGYQVYRVTDTGGVRRLTGDDCGTTQAAWAPDGRTIFYARQLRGPAGRSCTVGNIWAMAPDGSAPRAITGGDEVDDAPDVSPDGRLIAFDSSRGAPARGRREIYVANADGTGMRRLTTFAGHDAGPRFTADGATIVFSRSPGSEDRRFMGDPVNLWSVPVLGGPERALTAGGGFLGGAPAPSPDGTAVAFSDRGRLYVMDLLAGGLREVGARPEGRYDVEPAWSPDGRELAFGRTVLSGTDEQGTDLMRVSATGAGPARRVVEAAAAGFQVRWADWWAPARARSAAAGRDDDAPTTLLGSAAAGPRAAFRLGGGARASAAQRRRPLAVRPPDLTYLTLDRSGVRRVEIAFTRRGARGPLRYRTIENLAGLRRIARRLPRATYDVRVRATDERGNRTRRPRPVTIRLR